MRPYAVTRQVTGRGHCHHAYVRDADNQRVISHCRHAHRTWGTAGACAQKQLRRVMRLQRENYEEARRVTGA